MSVIVKIVAAEDDGSPDERAIDSTGKGVGAQLLHKFHNALKDENFCPETRNALRNAFTSVARDDR